MIVIVIAVAAGGAAAAFYLSRPSAEPDATHLEASGTVEATEIHLGFPAGGRLDVVVPREGDRVAEGSELARLAHAELTAQLRMAKAKAAASQARLAELEKGSRAEDIRRARAARDAASARLKHAKSELASTEALVESGVVTPHEYDKVRLSADVADKELTQAEEQLRLLLSGPRSDRIEAQRQETAGAAASVEAIQAALVNTRIVAPIDGIVTSRHREPGEIVPPGSSVLTILDPSDRWVLIYVKEDRIGAVRLGMAASIVSDTFPDKRYAGEVAYIASQAEFTPKNVQTLEERVKLVYAVKVRIISDVEHELKAGIPVDVALELEAAGKVATR